MEFPRNASTLRRRASPPSLANSPLPKSSSVTMATFIRCYRLGALSVACSGGSASALQPSPHLIFSMSSQFFSKRTATPSYALRGICVRRTPRACHGACARLRPGRLRASHAVCLRYSTLEPVLCARKEEADIECVSTTGKILAESLVMRGDFFDTQAVSFGFYSTSRHCIARLSPRNSNRNEVTANNGAAANRSGRGRSVTACASASGAAADSGRFSCAPPLGTGCASPAPPSAVAELESLAAPTRRPTNRHPARHANSKPTTQ